MMPKLARLKVITQRRQDPHAALTRITFLTARSADGHIDEAFERGADDYMIEPFKPD